MTATLTTTFTTARTLHLVDIENLVGDPYATQADALDALHRYLATAGYRDGDHVVIAANPGLMAQLAFDLPIPCNVHAARGEDGADRILLAQADPAFVAARYDRLVVGSGDGAFTETVLAVRDRGLPVVVVARGRSLSGRFRGAGLGIRVLAEPLTLAA